MGGGAKKHTEYFKVGPAVAQLTPDDGGLLDGDQPDGDDLPATLQLALDLLHHGVSDDDPHAVYAQLTQAVAKAQQALAAEAAAGLDPAVVAAVDAAIKQASVEHLQDFDAGSLQQLAAAAGFQHPTLVGLSNATPHPLVHWLDPAHPPDSASKSKIQAKAAQRWAALAAGKTIGGLTYQAVAAQEAALGGPVDGAPAGLWTAAPAEVAAVMATLADKVATLPPSLFHAENELGEVLAAERKLATATCPELGGALEQLKASANHLVDSKLDHSPGLAAAMGKLAPQLQADGQVTAAEAAHLSAAEVLALVRPSTPPHTAEAIRVQALQRAAQVDQLTQLAAGYHQHYQGGTLTLGDLGGGDAKQQLAGWATTTAAYLAARDQVREWNSSALQPQAAAQLCAGAPGSTLAQQTTTGFRQWAKTQKLAELRAVAAAAGLDHAKAASRAQVQNYIAARWDKSLAPAAIQQQVAAKATVHVPGDSGNAGPASKAWPDASAPGKPTPATTPSAKAAPAAGSFGGKLATLVTKLRAHQAVAADVPPPLPDEQVAAYSWGPGKAFNAGSHASTIHEGPDGRSWMFKPDKTGGARAHAEAAAAKVFRSVGVAGVGVHVVDLAGKTGAIQPLVKGATHFSDDPASWSQADVDALVGMHAAAWAVGDHDGHSGNVLRTPSGGVMACDQGQAFKFFGRDRLEPGWKPGSNPDPPLYHRAYRAHTKGGLAPGVAVRAKAALPVIKAFEAIPEHHYRAMLADTAQRGVKAGLPWVAAMRQQAIKRLGKPTVDDTEVAEEFLRTAVQRKNTLRASFASFFAQLGVTDANHLQWVG